MRTPGEAGGLQLGGSNHEDDTPTMTRFNPRASPQACSIAQGRESRQPWIGRC